MAGYYGGAEGGAAAAAIANAIKAAGGIVRLEPGEFAKILVRTDAPLVVTGFGGVFTRKNQYLANYKGIFFFTESRQPLQLPYKAEQVEAKNIWMPR
ncbi:MAG: hypothetical protein AB1644_12580 [Candidatus Zixiibacteriota bacterium]